MMMTKRVLSGLLMGVVAAGAGAQGTHAAPSVAGLRLMQGAQGEGQAAASQDDLFAGAQVFEKNATSVSEINMTPKTLGMVSGEHASDAHRMVLNTVLTYEYDQPGLYNMADVDKIRQKLQTGDWSCSVHERNLKTGESTDVCEKARTDGYSETAIVTVEKKELTFIHRIEKDGPGGHSEVSFGPMMGEMDAMPAMAMVNSGKMALEMAKLQAHLATGMAGMHGNVVILPDGVADGKSTFFLDEDTVKDGVRLKLKKLEGAPSDKILLDMDGPTSPDVPVIAPPASAAPAPEPAPAPAK